MKNKKVLLTLFVIMGVFLFSECVETPPTPTATPPPMTEEPDIEPGMMWMRIFNQEGSRSTAHCCTTDSCDNVIVAGRSEFEDGFTFRTIKYDVHGDVLWNRLYSEGHTASGVATDSHNNIIVTGYSPSPSGSHKSDYVTIKCDPDGNLLWERRYDGGEYDRSWNVAVDLTDNIVVTGETKDGDYDYYTIKYDPDGNVLWSRRYDGGEDDYAYGIATDLKCNIIVTGYSNGGYYTVKYDPEGNVLWSKRYDSGDHDSSRGVATDSDNNIIVVGRAKNKFCTVKYDPHGNLLWERRVRVEIIHNPEAVAVDSRNNIIVVGAVSDTTIEEYVGEHYDYCTIKYDPDGNFLWIKTYDGGSKDYAEAVVADSADNITVAGYSLFNGKWSFLIIKYMGEQNSLFQLSFQIS